MGDNIVVVNNTPKISVILTTHNYAKFLGQAIESVLNQTYQDFELIIVNDGSTDHTDEVLSRYKGNPKIRVLKLEGVGLASACNTATKQSKGRYIIRLDADDYFDENMLLVESNILDSKPDIHLVYSDYFTVDYAGSIMDHYRLMKSNDELKLLDRAPLGAGAMYHKYCYDEISGYNDKLRFQEDYDFWLKFTHRFKVYNVRLPLMYYRKHEGSMSTNTDNRLMARRYVKHEFVKKHMEGGKKIVGFIRESVFLSKGSKPKLSLADINGYPLIYYPISALQGCDYIEEVHILTDDAEVEETSVKFGAKSSGLQPVELSMPSVTRAEVIKYYLKIYDKQKITIPDIIVTISSNCPFIKPYHIIEAIDTMMIHNYDSVISVMEHYDFYWRPGPNGLVSFGYNRKTMKEDQDTLYLETGGIRVVKTRNLLGDNWLGNSIGFIELTPREAMAVENNDFSLWLFSQIMKEGYNDEMSEGKYLFRK